MPKKKRKISKKKINRFLIILLICLLILFTILIITKKDTSLKITSTKDKIKMNNYIEKNIQELEEFAKENNLTIEKEYEYSSKEKDIIIAQDIKEGTQLKKGDIIKVTISKGEVPVSVYQENKVNPLGGCFPILLL